MGVAGESPRAKQAWADYLALGPDRSLEKLHRLYLVRVQSEGNVRVAPPTLRLATLEHWSSSFGWQARLAAIADREARAAEEREAAYRRSIMEEGYATAHERVRLLKRLTHAIARDLNIAEDAEDMDPRFWVQDVKGIGGGETYREVTIERFNAAEVAELRAALADLAAEKGDRVRRTELTGKGGGPVDARFVFHYPDNGRGPDDGRG